MSSFSQSFHMPHSQSVYGDRVSMAYCFFGVSSIELCDMWSPLYLVQTMLMQFDSEIKHVAPTKQLRDNYPLGASTGSRHARLNHSFRKEKHYNIDSELKVSILPASGQITRYSCNMVLDAFCIRRKSWELILLST